MKPHDNKCKHYDDEEFVMVWITNETVQEVADVLGRTYRSVQAHASRLREGGVNIPPYKRSKALTPATVQNLNSIIEKNIQRNS